MSTDGGESKTPDQIVLEQVGKLTTTLEVSLEDGVMSPSELFDLCIQAMQVAEKMPKLSGPEKKQVVTQAIERVFQRKGYDPTLLPLLNAFIDIIINVDKRLITVKIKEATKCCFALCKK